MMRSHLVRNLSTQRQAQAGAALLLMMTMLAVGAAFMLLRALNSANPQIQRDQETYQALAQAKEALINWAVVPTGGALGRLPFPDILDTIDEPSPDYNGEADVHCPDTSSSVRPTLAVASRCFGRLPWKTLNLAPATLDQQDAFGEIPWYAVSANLLDSCLNSRLNPALLNATYPTVATYNCGVATQLPHPWLVVRDHLGNILSNRVAFVLIMPRQKIGTQNRYLPLSLPRNYIDAVTVTCAAPTCTPGTYDNGSFNPGNQFIAGLDITKVEGYTTNYAQPYFFNDRLIYVTIDELMFAMEKRALQEARAKLLAFYGSKQYFPYTAAIGSLTGSCVDTNLQGFLPLQQGTCSPGDFLDLTVPSWFATANWKNFIFYAVGSACVPGTNKCEGSGTGFLKLGNGTQNTQAILIATGRPVADVTGQIPSMSETPSVYAASLTRAQTGCCSTLAIDYLDSTANADGNEVFDARGLTRSTIYNDYISVVAP